MSGFQFQYTKVRNSFGKQPMFCEQGPEMCDSIVTDPTLFKQFILRNPVHELIQHTPVYSHNYINTKRVKYTTTGINHSEGGWPKDINLLDPEQPPRYRRKIEKEDPYLHCVQHTTPGLAHFIKQNNAIDLYRSYFCEIPRFPNIERNSLRTVNQYKDKFRRPVTSIAWPQHNARSFAVSYADVDFYRVPKSPTSAYIWDVENSNQPDITLQPVICPIMDLRFNPKNDNMLIAGLMSGQVATFDKRTAPEPVAVSPQYVSHRDLVATVLFIHSKTGTEFFSGSADGSCKWWDARKFTETTDEFIMDTIHSQFEVQTMAKAHGVSVMEYESTIPTRFMAGTEDGMVVTVNRKGKTPMEKLAAEYHAHLGPVRSIQRNPAFPKVFLTAGDYRMCVFNEDCRESPTLWTSSMRHMVYSAVWSPTRISVMTISGGDGVLAVWDLLRRQNSPILTLQLSDTPLIKQSFHTEGALVNVGNTTGTVFMVELSPALTDSERNDKTLLANSFERESKRERIMEAKLRELKLKMRQAEEGSPVLAASQLELDTAAGDRDLIDATNEFNATVKKELAMM